MRRAFIVCAAAIATIPAGCVDARGGPAAQAASVASPGADGVAMKSLLEYAKSQNTTGLLVMRHGRVLVERNWPAPSDKLFAIFDYGRTADGQLLEDVASQQKSFVSVLVGIAIDKGLIDVTRPVDDYLGQGWSKATPEQEARIRVIDVLTMSSGLDEKFTYTAPPGTRFFYNTAVYAVSKRILTDACGQSLETITRDWLTAPLGMKDTAWRKRPPALADVGNNTGLVTTPRDSALFGQMVLAGGLAADGRRIISRKSLRAMFERSQANPAYGRLWWLNGSDYTVGAFGKRKAGELIPDAPRDLVAALGYLDRRVYVVPSLDVVVVRTGGAAHDKDFDVQLWKRLDALFAT